LPEAGVIVVKIIVDCLRLQAFGVLQEYIYEQLKEFEGVHPEKVSLKEPVEEKPIKKILNKAYEEVEYEQNIAGEIQSTFPSPEDLRKSLPE